MLITRGGLFNRSKSALSFVDEYLALGGIFEGHLLVSSDYVQCSPLF